MTVLVAGNSGVNILKSGATKKQSLSDANSTVNKGLYDAALLEIVDPDLVVGNIKNGVTIFGKLGTLASTLSQDIVVIAPGSLISTASAVIFWYYEAVLASHASFTMATLTQVYDAVSMAVAVGVCLGICNQNASVLRLYMAGVLVATSGTLNGTYDTPIIGTKALSGNQTCYVEVYNTGGVNATVRLPGGVWGSGQPSGGGIGVGSIKLS